MTSNLCYLDFETRSKLDLRKVGVAVYAAHPSTDILCLAYDSGTGTAPPDILIKSPFYSSWLDHMARDDKVIFVAHNAGFEQAIWSEIMVKRYGYPPISIHRWKCTMAKSAACGLPQKLETVAKVLKLPAQKDMEGNASMLVLSRPRKDGTFWTPEQRPDHFAKLYKYCQQDVLVEQQLDESLPDLTPYETRVWRMNERINQSGVNIDVPLVRTVMTLLDEHKIYLRGKFCEITGETFPPTQRAKFKEWLWAQGLEVPDTKATTLEPFAEDHWDAGIAIQIFLDSNKSSLAKFKGLIARVSADNRLRNTAAYHAAHTGRFGGRGVQLQNLFRGKHQMETLCKILSIGDYEFFKWAYDEASRALSSSIRGMFIPDDGYDFLIGDLSGIEARVLAWLAGQEDKLEMFRQGIDPYVTAAQSIFPNKNINKEKRLVGKVSELALGYQGGISAYLTMTKGCRVDLEPMIKPLLQSATQAEMDDARYHYMLYRKSCKTNGTEPCSSDVGYTCNLIKFRWRRANPKIVAFWRTIECAAIEAVQTKQPIRLDKLTVFLHGIWLCMKLPSGRIMRYCFPKLESSTRSTKLSYYSIDAIRGWSRSTTYGGSLTENIVQAIARDIFVDALLQMEGTEYETKFHVHDEAIVQVLRMRTENLDGFTRLLDRVPRWSPGLPIEAEAFRATRYEKR